MQDYVLERDVHGEVGDEEDIRLRGEDFVLLADTCRVDTTCALVGHAGEIISVENDDAAAGNGRGDEILDVLSAVFKKIIQFVLDVEASRGRALTQFASPRAIGRFKALHHLVTLFTQGVGEHGGLGGFSGAIDPFDDDEFSLRGNHLVFEVKTKSLKLKPGVHAAGHIMGVGKSLLFEVFHDASAAHA